jgi:hypothetical protein
MHIATQKFADWFRTSNFHTSRKASNDAQSCTKTNNRPPYRLHLEQVRWLTDMNAEGYSERILNVEPWQVKLSSYKLGEVYHCKADNVSPGAALARTTGATREEAEEKALDRARQLLLRTRLHDV